MNRAWIPAGALAGVSVAGLLALAPLTDSLGTKVTFDPQVPVSPTLAAPLKNSVPVSVNLGAKGTISTTAAFKPRGGAAKVNTSSDAGQVAVPITPSTPSTPSATVENKTAPTTPKESDIKVKKVKRQTSIGGNTGANGDAGLAGGTDATTGVGEQSNTLGG